MDSPMECSVPAWTVVARNWRDSVIRGATRSRPSILASRRSVSRLSSDQSCSLCGVRFGSMGSPDDQDISAANKQAGLDHARNAVEGDFQFPGPIDLREMDINDEVARLSMEWSTVAFPKDHTTLGELFNVPCRATPAERHDLDGQRKGAT